MAKFGFKHVPLPDTDIAEGLIKDLFGKAECLLFTIADATVSSSSELVTGAKQGSDWLTGITNHMKTVIKVCVNESKFGSF